MIVRKIDNIISKVGQELELPDDLIRDVVDHYLLWFKDCLNNLTISSIVLPFLGTAYMVKSQYFFAIKNMLKFQRRHRGDKKSLETLSLLFKKRFDLYSYYQRNKLKGRKRNKNDDR